MSSASEAQEERRWGRALSKAATLCLAAVPLGVAALLTAEVVGWTTPLEKLWYQLELGSQGQLWPPPGTFLPSQPAATPGTIYPGGSVNGSVSRLAMFNVSKGLFQVELGTPTTTHVSLQNMSEYLTLAPGKSLPTTRGVWAMTSWVENGIVAGTQDRTTGAGTVEVWDADAVKQGAAARWRLPAFGRVFALLTLPNGGIIAATWTFLGALNVWPNRMAIQQQSSPLLLLPGFGASSLLILPSGALAVGAGPGNGSGHSVMIWSSVAMLLRGLPANITLPAEKLVRTMVALPNGGLAAGLQLEDNSGAVQVWWNSSAVKSGQLTARLISPFKYVTSLLATEGGGLVAGVCSIRGEGGLAIWPNASAVLRGGPSPVAVALKSIMSLLELAGAGGAIAAAAQAAVYMWPNMTAVLAGMPPIVSLQAPGQANSLLALEGGGLLAGGLNPHDQSSGPGAVHLWPYLEPLLHSRTAQRSQLQASKSVQVLLSLADGSLVAGTCSEASGLTGTVDVWRTLGATRVSLPASGCVFALLELGSGGLAAGSANLNTLTGSVDLWLHSSAFREGAAPTLQLPASGAVAALVNFSTGWLAAGTEDATGFGTVDLWRAGELKQGEPPVARLKASGAVSTLLELPGGGVAAWVQQPSTRAGAVDVWPNASCLFDGARPAMSVSVSGIKEYVRTMVVLPDGVIVAGTSASRTLSCYGFLFFWASASALQRGEGPLHILCVDATVYSLALLPSGGFAAVVESPKVGQRFVLLWPRESALMLKPPLQVLQGFSMSSLAVLAGGGIAAGTLEGFVDLWPSVVSVPGSVVPAPSGAVYQALELEKGIALGTTTAQGPMVEIWLSQPSGHFALEAYLAVASTPMAILQLRSGHLAVGTLNGSINFFTPSWAPAATLNSKGSVRALVELPAGGLAATVDEDSGSLVIWSTLQRALEGQQPDETVLLAFPPQALLWVEGSLLIGETKGLEQWTPSGQRRILLGTSAAVSVLKALPGGGLAIGTDDYLVRIWRVASDVLAARPPDFVVAVPAGAASIAVLEDGSLAAGGAVYVPVKCPAGEFSTGGRFQSCLPCRSGWLSEPGADNCSFSTPSSVVMAAGAVLASLFLGLVAAQLLRRFAHGEWEVNVARRCLVVGAAGTSLASFSTMAGTEEQWVQIISIWLGCSLLFFSPNNDNRYLGLGLLVLNLALAAQMLQAPQGQVLLTAVGHLTGPAAGSSVLLCLSLFLAGLAYALPKSKTLTMEQAGPAPEEHPREVLSPSGARQALEVNGAMPQPVRRCRCRAPLRRAAAALVRLASSFFGEHGLVLALGLITFGQMSWQLTQNAGTAAASTGLIVLSVLVAAAQCASSALAMLATCGCFPERFASALLRIVDRHLRLSIVLKYVALGLKLLVLVLPFQKLETDVYLWWQCETPALCPNTCTHNRGGTCGTATRSGNPVCICMAFEEAKVLILLNCLPAPFVSFGISVVKSIKHLRSKKFSAEVPFPRIKLLAQMILTVVPPVLQAIYFFLIYEVPAPCLAPLDVAIIIYPSLLMGLLANEAKRALKGWDAANFSTIFTDSLLMCFRPLTVLVAALGAVAAAARAKGISADPWPDVVTDCSSTFLPWALISSLLTTGSLAAASIGPVAAPERGSAGFLLGEGDTEEPLA